jgi:uncharacterized phage protein (predicted DNA packaging)
MALDVVVLTTGPLLTLDEAKAHLRVDGDDEDALIQTYMDAAVSKVLQYCNLSLVPTGEAAVAAFKAAALLVTGDLYANREPVLTDQSDVARLINPYRWLRV